MQALASVFEQLWEAQKPFVFFRTPASQQIGLYFQEDNLTHMTTKLETPGFVMRSFDSKNSFYLIPAAKKVFFDASKGDQPKSFGYHLQPTKKKKKAHIKNILSAQHEIAMGKFQKVVLSTKFECEIHGLRPISIFQSLENAHPDALVYLWYHPQTGGWLGASPERFLVETKDQFQTVALAGTLPQSENPEWSEKEKEEQQLVVDAIVGGLQAIAPNSDINCSDRYEKSAGNLVHLCTDISLKKGDFSAIDIIEKLHPTPAVGGVPKKESLEFIGTHEGYYRSFYTGILGTIDSTKKQLFVNLRCAALQPNGLTVFVGGGITAASDPEKEWQEILGKSETILQWV